MLPKTYRLNKASDIRAVLRSRLAAHGSVVTVRWRPSSQRRFTVVVSTKVSKRATARNRLKRQLRVALWRLRGSFPSADYVVLVRPHTPLCMGRVLLEDLQRTLTSVRQRSTKHRA